jgi:pentatricopeptide repeat protein
MLRRATRRFSTILPSGEKVERELSAVEREFVNLKETQFSKLGLYRKRNTNVRSLMKLFQQALPGNKNDYAACMYCVNHFYNFGVEFEHHEFTSRWLALAVETSRVDEAIEIVRTYHTWLGTPPRIELINTLMGMVKVEQARDLLKAVRENWQMPLTPTSYNIVISRLLAQDSVDDALSVWKDSLYMDVVLGEKINHELRLKLLAASRDDDAAHVARVTMMQQSGGLVDFD